MKRLMQLNSIIKSNKRRWNRDKKRMSNLKVAKSMGTPMKKEGKEDLKRGIWIKWRGLLENMEKLTMKR
jgi:hypothetical protein